MVEVEIIPGSCESPSKRQILFEAYTPERNAGTYINSEWRDDNIITDINSIAVLNKLRHWKVKYGRRKNLFSPRNLRLTQEFIYRTLNSKIV